MANLKEFNFRHQTVAPLESRPPRRRHMFGALRASELVSSQKEEEEEIICGAASMRGRQVAKNFQADTQAEHPLDSQGDAC